MVLGLDEQRVPLGGRDGQFVDGIWFDFDAIDFDHLHLVVLHREMEHYRAPNQYRRGEGEVGSERTGKSRHVDDPHSVFLACFEREDGFVVDTGTGGKLGLGVHVFAVLGDVDEGGFCGERGEYRSKVKRKARTYLVQVQLRSGWTAEHRVSLRYIAFVKGQDLPMSRTHSRRATSFPGGTNRRR